ncbi:MAG: hypothetical protein GXO35_07060 [Gammaproteobacteria bacterium]|nr:hypothetical protein [Gammaproteobacteria bacterium]
MADRQHVSYYVVIFRTQQAVSEHAIRQVDRRHTEDGGTAKCTFLSLFAAALMVENIDKWHRRRRFEMASAQSHAIPLRPVALFPVGRWATRLGIQFSISLSLSLCRSP